MRSSLKNGWLGCALLLLVAACGGAGGDGSAQLTYSPNAPPPPAGATGNAYTAFTFAPPTGGVGPFTWTVTGALPLGMSLSPSGQLSGTPQTAGTFPITLTVTDSSSPHQVVTESVTLDIADSPLVIDTTHQPPASSQFLPYPYFAFTAHGGSAPLVWSVTGGVLPAGLTLSSDGRLTGTATAMYSAGSTFTITVKDSSPSPESNSHSFAIVINKPTLGILTPFLPSGTDYVRYNVQTDPNCTVKTTLPCRCEPGGVLGRPLCFTQGFQLAAIGGTQPYSWKWAATTQSGLPAGLNLSSEGVLGGSPATAGTYGVVVTVTDSSPFAVQATANYTITIAPPPPPQFQTASTLAVGVNLPFTLTFSGTGGQTPLTWSETGSLPSGFSLSPAGVLSGTPLVTGSFPITINVQDSAGQNGTPQALDVIVTSHGFAMTGGMSTGRSQHTATLLPDGTVLVAAGNYNGTAVANCDLYSPASGAFSTAGPLATARYSHTATLLSTGQVLVAGGDDSTATAMGSAELYDPRSKTFTAVGNMVSARDSYTATLLGTAKVLLTGGGTDSAYGTIAFPQATAELFDSATGTFSATGSMSTPRATHTATLLGTGKVLIAGGVTANGVVTASAELYDPATGTFTLTGTMHYSRVTHTATLLANGTVLIAGGGVSGPPGQTQNQMLASAEIYDPKSGTFTTTGSMGTGRFSHAAALLSDGSVLVAGGIDMNAVPLVSAEVYDPSTGQFSLTGGMQTPRQGHTATLLSTGDVLVSGGNDATPPGLTVVPGGYTIGAISTAEVYQ